MLLLNEGKTQMKKLLILSVLCTGICNAADQSSAASSDTKQAQTQTSESISPDNKQNAQDVEAQQAKPYGFSELEETVRNLSGRVEELEHQLAQLQSNMPNATSSSNNPDNNEIEKISDKNAKDVVAEVETRIEKNELEQARRIAKQFIEKKPQDLHVGYLLVCVGNTYFLERQYQDAAIAYMDAYKKNPKSAKATEGLYKLALSFKQLNQLDKSKATFEKLANEYHDGFAQKAQTELASFK